MAAVVEIQVQVNPTDSAAKLNAVQAEIGGLGTASTAAAAKVGAATQQMAGSFARPLDSVRLLSQEFGMRMPRAIEAMLSRMPAVTNALSGMLGIMGGIAAAEIFVRVAEGVHKVYDEYLSLNAQQDKFLDSLKKMQEADFTNVRDVETAQRRSAGAAGNATALGGVAHASRTMGIQSLFQGDFVGAVAGFYGGGNAMGDSVRQQQQGITLDRTQLDLDHQLAVSKIELAHAQDSLLTGVQKNNAEAQKKIDLDKEQQAFDVKVQGFYGNVVPHNAGSEEQSVKDQTARAEAAAANAKLGQDSSLAIMKADDARVQAGLQGEDLYFRKMQDDIRETTRELENQGKAAEIPARVREINEKYFDDMSERAVKAQNESGLSIRRANAGGLTGAAQINANWDTQVSENNTKYASDPERLHAENVAAATDANQKLEDLQQQFSQRMESIDSGRVEATLNGYDRIGAEAAKTSRQIEDDFAKSWGGANVDQNSAQFLAAKQAEQDALTAVQQGANAKRTELTQANLAEDLRYDQQAADAERRIKENGALGWVAANKNAITAIEEQEQQRLAKLVEDANKEGLTEAEVAKRRTDIETEASAQIEQQQQAMAGRLSSLFESAFKDPIGTIKSTMEKLMFDLLAQWILHFKMVQALFGSAAGGVHSGGGAAGIGSSIAGSALSHIMGGGGSSSIPGVAASGGSGGGVSYRAPYSGMAAGPVGSSGMVTGAGSAGSVNGALSSAQTIAGMFGGSGSGSAMTAASTTADNGGLVFGPDGSVTDNATLPTQSMPDFNQYGNGGGGALATGMGIAGAAGAGYMAEQTTVSAFDQGNAKGILSGTMGDMAAGATIGSVIPGIGTAVGAAIGAGIGFISGVAGAAMDMGGKIAARNYYEKTLFPQIEADRLGQGGDTMSAISDVNRAYSQGLFYMQSHFGAEAADYVQSNYLNKEVQLALSQISAHAEGGSMYTGRQAMQFDTGGYIDGFGDMGTGGGHGLINAQLGETVMHQQATATHAPVLNAMLDGASPSDIAAMYLKGASGGGSSATMSAGGDTHYHIHTLDTKTMTGWLRGGGARMISKEQNNMAAQYAGDGVIG